MIKIFKSNESLDAEVFGRAVAKADVSQTVRGIIQDVRANGDAAVLAYERRFAAKNLTSLSVSPEALAQALRAIPADLLSAMQRAAKNIEAFHEKQIRTGFVMTKENGVVLGQRILPIEKVGLYIPGGTASYPSTVLMNAIPARLAGCKDIVMVSPAGPDGKIPASILAAAKLAGVTKVFCTGGAQAIAALAYGTQTVPAVYKITGPGNAYVAEAKRQVFGQVAIDMIAGPSEIFIISDGSSDPEALAADLLSQAEHDVLASAVLITTSEAEALSVQAAVDRQLAALPRREIAEKSIETNGKILIASDLAEAIALSNRLAPEHLELCVNDPFQLLCSVTNAGSVFLGRNTPEPLGDYFSGPNHTLPTMGTARFSSPLSVDDFVKKSAFSYYPESALIADGPAVMTFANAEGLAAHARSIGVRLNKAGM